MSLKEWLLWLKNHLKQRYVQVVFLVMCVFLFPDYTAPIFSILALILSAKEAKASGRKLFSLGASGKTILLFIVFMAISIIYSISRMSSALTVLMWLSMLGVYFALRAVITTNERFRYMVELITITVGILGVIGCGQYFLVHTLGFSMKWLHFFWPLDNLVSGIVALPSFDDDIRVASTFMNPNIFAMLMVMLIPLAYYSVGKAAHEGTRNLFIGCIVVGVFGIAFSFSRMSYLCCLILLLLTLVFIYPRLSLHQRRLLIFVIIAGLFFLFFTPNMFINRILKIHYGDASISEHFSEWEIAISAFINNPLLGSGAGIGSASSIMNSMGLNVAHAHNLYLELAVEGGVFALAIFFASIVTYFKNQIGKMFIQKRNNLLGFCMFSGMLTFLVFGLTDFPLITPGLVGAYIMLLSISDISIELYSEN